MKEGKDGKGLKLRKVCGFCTKRFRSQKQRTNHTNHCSQ